MPPIIIGHSAEVSDPLFLPTVGGIAKDFVNRSVWSLGPLDSLSVRVNALYKAKTGNEIGGVSSRSMQVFLMLAHAQNRAGSSDPARLQAALKVTAMPHEAVIIGYCDVWFDETGQNIDGGSY